MKPEQQTFFHDFGERLARLRKERGFTQTQLGDILGVSQQQVVAFEKGRRRIAVSSLPVLAQALEAPIEELLGEDKPVRRKKRGPTPKLQQQLDRVAQLPRSRQRFVSEMLETVLQQASR